MKVIIAYLLVIPFSLIASRLGAIIVALPFGLLLDSVSTNLRSIVVGIFGATAGVIAAVAFGYTIFNWLGGPDSFTLLPLIASLVLLVWGTKGDFVDSYRIREAIIKADVNQKFLANEVGNPWSTVIGDILGLIVVSIWFFNTI